MMLVNNKLFCNLKQKVGVMHRQVGMSVEKWKLLKKKKRTKCKSQKKKKLAIPFLQVYFEDDMRK